MASHVQHPLYYGLNAWITEQYQENGVSKSLYLQITRIQQSTSETLLLFKYTNKQESPALNSSYKVSKEDANLVLNGKMIQLIPRAIVAKIFGVLKNPKASVTPPAKGESNLAKIIKGDPSEKLHTKTSAAPGIPVAKKHSGLLTPLSHPSAKSNGLGEKQLIPSKSASVLPKSVSQKQVSTFFEGEGWYPNMIIGKSESKNCVIDTTPDGRKGPAAIINIRVTSIDSSNVSFEYYVITLPNPWISAKGKTNLPLLSNEKSMVQGCHLSYLPVPFLKAVIGRFYAEHFINEIAK